MSTTPRKGSLHVRGPKAKLLAKSISACTGTVLHSPTPDPSLIQWIFIRKWASSGNAVPEHECEVGRRWIKHLMNQLSIIYQCDHIQNLALFPQAVFQDRNSLFSRLLPSEQYLLSVIHAFRTCWAVHGEDTKNGWNCLKERNFWRDKRCTLVSHAAFHDSSTLKGRYQS